MLTLERLETRSMFAAGARDSTFGIDGVSTDSILGAWASAVAVDKQNRIVTAGVTAEGEFKVSRFEKGGSISGMTVSFGNATAGGYPGYVADFAIDGKGRGIIACGIPNGSGGHDVAVARVLPNGTLDQTFGLNGTCVFSYFDEIEDMAIDSKGRIILVGPVDPVEPGDHTDFGVTRLTANGQIDRSFGYGGSIHVGFDMGGARNDWATCVAIDSKGRVLVGGNVDARANGGFSYWDRDFGVVRLTPRGRVDTSFAGDGTAVISFDRGGADDDRVRAMAVDGRGRIVVLGAVLNAATGPTTDDYGIVRLTSGGQLDTTFGTGGKTVVSFDLGGENEDNSRSLSIDRKGRIIVAGDVQRGSSGDYDFGIIRLTAGGSLDSTFGVGGRTTIALDRGGSLRDRVTGLVVDRMGRIVVCGGAAIGNGVNTAAVVRLLG